MRVEIEVMVAVVPIVVAVDCINSFFYVKVRTSPVVEKESFNTDYTCI